MKKTILKILSYILVAALASCLTLALTLGFGGPGKLQQLENLLLHYHVDDPDRKALEDAAANAMVSAAGDRWSYYISAEQMQSYEENKKNAYVGIGVTVQQHDSGYKIIAVTQGGPSQEAGIQVEDILTHVDGKSLAGIPVGERDQLIKGKEGTKVSLTLLRQGKEVTVTVTRKTIQVDVATGQLLPDGVGYVKIVNFNTNCFTETVEVIEALRAQGATSILFDVRNNGGGYAHEMIQLLDYLLPEGVLFQTVDYAGNSSQDLSDAAFLDMPMAVLVNENSYSAAEFFAAALVEYEAAFVVGQKTSGKGYFQNTFPLRDGSAVAISTGKYCTPKGESLEGVGITPAYIVEVSGELAAQIAAGMLEYSEDPQIMKAIEVLKNGLLPEE